MLSRLSIITPILNRTAYIESAIQSVLNQNYSNVEHIIIDGGSTDGTLEVLSHYPHLKVITGKDQGMYDALNKGLDAASGDIIGFLNSDDLYSEKIFGTVTQYFRDEAIDAVSGKAQVVKKENDGSLQTVMKLSPPGKEILIETAIIGSTIFNAWFYRKSIIQQIGGFDPRFKISGDADLILRLALKGINYRALNSVHYLYQQHDDSLTFQLNSDKLLKVYKDQSLYIKKHAFSPEMPRKLRNLFNLLHANTCNAISRQYKSEKMFAQSFLWKVRASVNISLPIMKRLFL